MKSSFWFIFPFVFLIAACTNSNKALNVGDGATAILTLTATPLPSATATATATVTFTPTFTSTPTVSAAILTPVPDQSQVIDVSNVDQIAELAHWGNGKLYSLKLSSDGAKVIAVFSTGVRVYDAKSLVEISHLDTPIPDEYSVAWAVSSNGEQLMVLDQNETLTKWQLADGKRLGSIKLNRDNDLGCLSNPGSFVFSPDNKSIGIFGFCNGYLPASRLLLISAADLKILVRLEGIGEGAFSPDGKYLAAYGEENNVGKNVVKVFRTEDGFLLHTFENYKPVLCGGRFRPRSKNPWPHDNLWGEENTCVAFSPDGKNLAVGFYDATRLYNVSDGSEAGPFTHGRPWFSADGRLLWIDNLKQSIGIDLTTNRHVNYPSTLTFPLVSPAGTYLTGMSVLASYQISGSSLLDLNAGKNVAQFDGYSGSVFSADEKYVAFYSIFDWGGAKPVLLVQTATGELLQTLDNEDSPVFLPDGKSLLTVSGNNIIVRTLPGREINYSIPNAAWPQALPDGESLITLEGNHITRRRISDGEVLAVRPFPVSPENIVPAGTNILETSVSGNRFLTLPKLSYQQEFGAATILSPDGTHYAVSLMDDVEVWQADDPSKPVYTIPTGGQNRVDFSSDGALIGIDKMNGDLEVRDVQTGDLIQTLKIGLSRQIVKVVFTPDKQYLYMITYQSRRYAMIGWKLTDGATLGSDSVKYDGPIAISADSKYLAFERAGGNITVVQIPGWLPIYTLETGNGGSARMAFSPDGGLLVSANAYGEIRFWELSTGTLVRTILPRSSNEYNSGYTRKGQFGVNISFSPDGRFLLSSTGGVARIWGVP